jgi:membrane associated rhomboid family serine protease
MVFGGGPMTPGVKGIIIACVIIFLAQSVLPGPASNPRVPNDLGNSFEELFGLSSQGFIGKLRLWQPVTYIFLHSTRTLFHLLFNMLMIWMFGCELERRWGTQAFLQFFVFCGVGAGLLSVGADLLVGAFSSGPLLTDLYTIGASGSVYGLLAAQGILFPNRVILLFLFFPMRMRTAVLFMAGLAFWVAFTSPGSTVNHIAHLGGMAFGWIYLYRAWNLRRIWHEWRWKVRRRKYKVVSDIRDDDRYRFH